MKLISITTKKFMSFQIWLIGIVLFVGLASYVFAELTGNFGLLGFLRLLDVGEEQSIPTLVSTLNLLLAACLLGFIYSNDKQNKIPLYRYWLFLMAVFLLLAIDEAASIHENFGNIYVLLVEKGLIENKLNSHKWLPFGILFVVIFLIVIIPFLIKLNRKTLFWFVFSGVVFVGGAIGVEYLGALMMEQEGMRRKSFAFRIRRMFEEGFEMIGIGIFNCALFHELVKREFKFSLKFQ